MGHDIFVQQRFVLISEGLIWWAVELEWGFDCGALSGVSLGGIWDSLPLSGVV